MGAKIDYQKLYDTYFNNMYEVYVSEFEMKLRKPDKIAKSFKKQEYISVLIKKREDYTHVLVINSSYNVDAYIIKLLEEFKHSDGLYDEDVIESFFKLRIPIIKKSFENRQKEIVKPETFKLDAQGTLKFVAEYLALDKFINVLSNIHISKEDTIDEIIQWLKTKGKKEKPIAIPELEKGASNAQRVLAIYFIFESLGIKGKRKLSAKARFIKMLTDKNESNIKVNLNKILDRKSIKEDEKDLLFIQKYFLELGCIEISNKIRKELEVLEKISKNKLMTDD